MQIVQDECGVIGSPHDVEGLGFDETTYHEQTPSKPRTRSLYSQTLFCNPSPGALDEEELQQLVHANNPDMKYCAATTMLQKRFKNMATMQIHDQVVSKGLKINSHPALFAYFTESTARSHDYAALLIIHQALVQSTEEHLRFCARSLDTPHAAAQQLILDMLTLPKHRVSNLQDTQAAEGGRTETNKAKTTPVKGRALPRNVSAFTNLLELENPVWFRKLCLLRRKFVREELDIFVEDDGCSASSGQRCELHSSVEDTEQPASPAVTPTTMATPTAVLSGNSCPKCLRLASRPFIPSLSTYGAMLRCYGHQRDLDMVLWLWNHLFIYSTHVPESLTYGCFLDALVQCCDINRALKMFRHMQGEDFRDLFDDEGPVSIPNMTPVSGLKKSTRSGPVEEKPVEARSSCDAASLALPPSPSSGTMHPCLASLSAPPASQSVGEAAPATEQQHNEECDGAAERMAKTGIRGRGAEGLSPTIKANTIMYSTLIKGFATMRMANRALLLYKEMLDRSVPVNTVTFNSLVNACARSGAMKEAAQILDQMLKINIQPDLVTFSTVVKGYCLKGEVERAFRLMLMLKSKGGMTPDSILYNTLLDGCVRFKKLDLCEQVWNSMINEDNILPSNFTLTIFIKLYGKLGQMPKVFNVLETFPRKYCFKTNAHVYTCVMSACITNGMYDMITPMFKKLLDLLLEPFLLRDEVVHRDGDHHYGGVEPVTSKFEAGSNRKTGGVNNSRMVRSSSKYTNWTNGGSLPDIKSYETALHGLYRGRLHSEGFEVLALYFGFPTNLVPVQFSETSSSTRKLSKKMSVMWLEVLHRKRDSPTFRSDIYEALSQLCL